MHGRDGGGGSSPLQRREWGDRHDGGNRHVDAERVVGSDVVRDGDGHRLGRDR
jgi:hypothetical protein